MNIFLQQMMTGAMLYLNIVRIQLNTICFLMIRSNDAETMPHSLRNCHLIIVNMLCIYYLIKGGNLISL